MTYSALFSVSFLCSNVEFMIFVYSVSALEVLIVYTLLVRLVVDGAQIFFFFLIFHYYLL